VSKCSDCTEWPLVHVDRREADGAEIRVCLRAAKIVQADDPACGLFEGWEVVTGPASEAPER
jgi:hypothetical protein